MTYTIGKTFTFAASHRLDGLPDGHQCGRLHGHNYTVCVEIEADQPNENGMVFDFGDMSVFREYLNSTMDHRHLNDVVPVSPTAEALARQLFDAAATLLGYVTAVTVWETPTCFATYRP